MTSHPTDDGFHEIQLNGKQLVFLFMAATVVSVVIFLCGVLVGRGVRAERGGAESADLGDVPIVDQTTATGGIAPAESDPRAAPPPAAVDDLTYFSRLEKPEPGLDALKQPASKPSVPESSQVPARPEPPPTPAVQPAAKPLAPKPTPVAVQSPPPAPARGAAASAAAAGAKPGFVVQLAALNTRGEADAMAKRLTAKGYNAYVQAPADGAPSIFRVRVGSYPTRSEAETVAAKLEKEGQFKPWVAPR